MFPRRRQRGAQEDLRAAIARLERAAAALENVAAAFRAAARSPGPSEKAERWRYRRLAGLCIVILILALTPLSYLAPAFQPASTFDGRYGAMALAVEQAAAPSGVSGSPSPVAVGAASDFEPDTDGDYIAVYLYFPARYRGHRFALALSGTAVLRDVGVLGRDSLGRTKEMAAGMAVKPCRDSFERLAMLGPIIIGGHTFTESCQLITGKVPDVDPIQLFGDDALAACYPTDSEQYVKVEVIGAGSFTSQPDWAHRNAALPSVDAPSDLEESSRLTHWSGLAFGAPMYFQYPKVCETVELSSNYDQYESSDPAPGIQTPSAWSWASPVRSPSMVGTRSDATTIGNLLLAAMGAGLALTIGLIPVVYDARRSWRAAVKRTQHAAGPKPRDGV